MRFSAIAVSAAVFGVAMAVPAVVYETEVVTITSCAPEKTNCPLVLPPPPPRLSRPLPPSSPSRSTPRPRFASSPAVEPVASVPAAGSSAPVESVTIPASSTVAAVETPAVSSPAAGTGSVSAPAAVPTSATGTVKAHESIPSRSLEHCASAVQDTFEGAAAAKGFSFAAVALAAAAYVLV
ncbi:uncharacterized protein LAJ45_02791 [Morchella importuna]|uniref:uncharacterized protein n=1 Tax=Morchella importuna TaxID=1174673 RepID=UPI001E8EC2ED|nr:uncharacterized protein LAJ45_02791 [Morchella importuna]KAH8153204.1 hypothetical protein LAJ45_02791 [Morchella importuna]